jgi:hypothetical protein
MDGWMNGWMNNGWRRNWSLVAFFAFNICEKLPYCISHLNSAKERVSLEHLWICGSV